MKWLRNSTAAEVYDPYNGEIFLREVHNTHAESHNSIGGNPTFRVRLECPWQYKKNAISRLLGRPEIWPKDTVLQNMYAVSAEVISDGAEGVTDNDGQIIEYPHNALIDVTYAQRPGIYYYHAGFGVDEWLYIYDEISHRNEAFPLDHNKFIWGDSTNPATVPTDKLTLTPYEAPVEYLPGYTFTRTIEGWCMDVPKSDLLTGPIPGTTNLHDCASINLKRKFKAGTLLYRTAIITTGISFRSYRFPVPGGVLPPKYDLSGLPTMTLKLIYEYREDGWDKFRRVKVTSSGIEVGWYYILANGGTYPKYDPFPRTDHRIFLGAV